MTKQTRKLIINISIIVVLTGLMLMILLLSYRELSFENIGIFLSQSKAWCIVMAFVCMLMFIAFEGLAIWAIARRLGHKPKIRGAMAYSSSDIYYSAITPSASGGQPASMFYMVRDGMSGGVAGFTLITNLMAYTGAIIVMGIFAFIARPGIFTGMGHGFAQTLVIIGFVLQGILLGFFILCLTWSKAILKIGNGAITLLTKIKIIKKPEKWRNKWAAGVEKYRACRQIFKEHPAMFIDALILNLVQRVSQTLIPCFVCYAVDGGQSASFLDLFCMQTYVLLGYNMVPLPGGVGAYEYLYARTYGVVFQDWFMLSAMMVSRVISYYSCMVVSGVYTLIYHSLGMRKKKDKTPEPHDLNEWQLRLYSEGEQWCGETEIERKHAHQHYTEGENIDRVVHSDAPAQEQPDQERDAAPDDTVQERDAAPDDTVQERDVAPDDAVQESDAASSEDLVQERAEAEPADEQGEKPDGE